MSLLYVEVISCMNLDSISLLNATHDTLNSFSFSAAESSAADGTSPLPVPRAGDVSWPPLFSAAVSSEPASAVESAGCDSLASSDFPRA